LFFLYGNGANGKSVFVNTLLGILSDYATTAPSEIFMESKVDRHPTEMADLRGARLVAATETEQGRGWAEAKIKKLTGGEKIKARFMRQDFFSYQPHFKLVISGNHKPRLRNVDEAIRRRLRLIPFRVTIPETERDPDLTDKLKQEWPGILRWAIDGCLEWWRDGLNAPGVVVDATRDYLEAEDTFPVWLDERCRTDEPSSFCGTTALFADFKQWAEDRNERPGGSKTFSQTLEDRGFKRGRRNGAGDRGFHGIALKREEAS
jgi:putative DNA primase/helicase